MAESKSAQQVREITEKLEQGIKELFESERFKEYLRTMSKFYHYSFSNILLIAMQKPEATYVAGYTSWQRNFDRQVMKGEKGIKIYSHGCSIAVSFIFSAISARVFFCSSVAGFSFKKDSN